jgi:hypothetical protein
MMRSVTTRAVGWLGLAAFLWAALGLPALHALEHAREAEADAAAETAHADDVHQLLRETLALARGEPPSRRGAGHHHRHDGGTPGTPDPAHGHGSAQHFSLAVLDAAPPALPPRASTFEILRPTPPAGLPAARDVRSSRTSRGPPAPRPA